MIQKKSSTQKRLGREAGKLARNIYEREHHQAPHFPSALGHCCASRGLSAIWSTPEILFNRQHSPAGGGRGGFVISLFPDEITEVKWLVQGHTFVGSTARSWTSDSKTALLLLYSNAPFSLRGIVSWGLKCKSGIQNLVQAHFDSLLPT